MFKNPLRETESYPKSIPIDPELRTSRGGQSLVDLRHSISFGLKGLLTPQKTYHLSVLYNAIIIGSMEVDPYMLTRTTKTFQNEATSAPNPETHKPQSRIAQQMFANIIAMLISAFTISRLTVLSPLMVLKAPD